MKKNVLLLLLLCHFGLFAQNNAKSKAKAETKKATTPIATAPDVEHHPTQIFNTGIIFHSPYELTDANLITKEVVTYGKVVQVSAKFTWDGKPMYFINLEKKYPHNLITIMAFKDSYENDYNKIKDLLGKTILVSGKVEVDEKHKQEGVGLKPSISIFSNRQIRIISDF